MSFDLSGKVVFVTGSARRLGRAIALGFANAGVNLVIHHSSRSSAEAARSASEEARAAGVDAITVTGNQASSDDVARMFAAVRAHYGKLDVMVNSAAIFRHGDLLEIEETEWDLVMDVNLKGPFLLTQHAARLMIERGTPGVIINIGDNSGLAPWPSRPHHSVSKAGVIMLTKVSALALAPHGIRVNCVVPGPILPPEDQPRSLVKGIITALPVGHLGSPADVAHACVFLAQNEFTTGAILSVDGGQSLVSGHP